MAYHTIQPVPLTRWQRVAFVAALIALALASSWNGVFNAFVYDDQFIVLANTAMHDLRNWWRFFGMPYWPADWGSDGYRPLTILAYSLEWAAGHGKPWVFHAVNIGLYAGVAVAVFFLAETCLPFAAAFIAAALFAVHPVHVEAVANTVGQSELLVAVFMVPAVTMYIRGRNGGGLTAGPMITIALLYLLACLSKEHGFVLPALLLAAEVILVVDKAPLRARLIALRPFGLALAAIAMGYLWAHSQINHEITGFHPYVPFSVLGVGETGRVFTMFGLAPEWFRLLLWPAHLSAEYGPPAYPVVNNFALYQVPGMVAVAGVLAIGIVTWRKAPAVSFGIWFLVVTLLPTSNFIVPSGLLIAERTMLTPSIGAMIALGGVVPWLYGRLAVPPKRLAAAIACSLVIALGAWRSYDRTKVWKDNDMLFQTVVVDAPLVYRSHYMLGAWKLSQKRKVEGEREYQKAMRLYDKDPYVYYSLGEEYRLWGIYDPAITMFRKALEVDTTMFEARARLALSLAALGRWPEANREAILALTENTRSARAMLGVVRLAGIARKHGGTVVSDSVLAHKPTLTDSGKLPAAVQKAAPQAASAAATKPKPPLP